MMENLFLRVLAVSVAVSLLLLPLPLCRRWLERKYAPQTRWALWLGLALVLLIAPWVPKPRAPVVVEAPVYTVTLPGRTHKAPALPKAQPVTPAGELTQPAVPESGQTGSMVPAWPEAQAQANARPAASGEDQAIGFQMPAIPLTTLLSVLWLVGLALVLLWQVGCYLLVRRRLLREAKPVTGLERYAAKLGLEGRVAFYHCKAVPGPMTLGVFHPIVLLPPEGLAVAALCHELYHVKRRDVAYKLLLLSACSLHWFNPLVWLMYRWADRDVEACCDAAVVAGQDNGYRRSYGELLLSAAVGGRNLPFTTSFGGRKEQMKGRLTQLFRPGRQSRALVCIVLALAAVLGSLVACRQEKTGELADGVYCSPYANVVWPVGEPDAEGEDYTSIGLSLLNYDETGPHGKPLGEFTLPLAAEAEVDENWMTVDYMNTPEGWQKRLETFLRWPVMRNSIPAGMDYLVVTVEDGEITRLSWALVDRDTRYTNETYGFTLRLPEDWFGRYTVREEEGMVWFYQKNGKEGMKPLFRVVVDPISILEPYRSEDDPSGYAWVVSEFAEVLGETEEYLFRIVREPELEWYGENDQSEEAREYREMSQQAWRLGKDAFALISEPSGDPLLTESDTAPLNYHEPDWGFTLHLPESLEGQYYVEKGANYWLFHDKAQSEVSSGFLLGLWAEDSDTFRALGNKSKILGEKGGITYSLSAWSVEDMDGVPEERQEAYAAMLRDVSGMDARDLDLSGVTRSSGYLWPLPYTEYGSDVLLGESPGAIGILSPENMAVQCVKEGEVVKVNTLPATGGQEVVVAHPDGRYSRYRNLEYVQVVNGAQVKRGEILGYAKEKDGRRALGFSLTEESETWRPIDPWSVEYRTYDFLPVTRDNVTVAGDPIIENTLWSVLRGERGFHNMETGESCFTTALPDSDGVPVTVCRYAQVDMDNDTIPELALWLRRGDDIYQLGSIILRYEGGVVYGYPMGYRSMNPNSLKEDGSYLWSGGATNNGWGRRNLQREETENISWIDGESYYVDGQSATREEFYNAYDEQEAKPNVEWRDFTGENMMPAD